MTDANLRNAVLKETHLVDLGDEDAIITDDGTIKHESTGEYVSEKVLNKLEVDYYLKINTRIARDIASRYDSLK